jgi:hypothetical protein
MNMNRLSNKVLLSIAVLILMPIFLYGCNDLNFAGATLSEATMCKSADPKTLAPQGKTNIFTPDFTELHCNAKISNAPEKTKVKAQFIDSKKSIIIDSTVEVKGTEYVDFRMVRSKDPWVEGDYSVVLYLNGKEMTTVKYKIQREIITGVPEFTEVTICKAIDTKTGKALDTTSTFPADFTTVYLSVRVNNATPNTEIKVRWFAPDDSVITENITKFTGTGYLSFGLDRTGNPWATGSYSVAIFMNGTGDIIVPFLIK